MKKRNVKNKALSFLIIMILVLMTACGNNEPEAAQDAQDNKISVVTSFYPIYYMTSAIGGEHVKVTNLIATGIEPHDWSPKSKDLLTASKADLLLYHGVGLETWIDNFKQGLEQDSNVDVKEVSTGIELIDTTAEEDSHTHAEATLDEHEEHDHDAGEEAAEEHDHDHGHSHSHSHGLDPHTWVSPKSALILAENIKNSLVEVDTEHAEAYEQNYEKLKSDIIELDTKYEEQLAQVERRTIVVSHQSFGYVARDYNLEQISIMGLSPSAEPRAQDIKRIAELVKEQGVKVIFFEELVSDNLAKMLASEAKVDTNVIYSLEGLTTKQEQAGENYLTLMEQNLQNIVEALQ